ncbi:MAG: hypothetical protein ACE5HA_18545, partial [Anaerolineae bacterium]
MSNDNDTVTLEEWVNAACGAVVDAMRDGSEERKAAVAGQIADVENQLPAELSELTALLDTLRALLAGEPAVVAGDQLSDWYAEVFHRVVKAIDKPAPVQHEHLPHGHGQPHVESTGRRMDLGEALEQMAQDTIHVMRDGSREDRAQMAQGFEVLRFQAAQAMQWPAFAEFLQALQGLLRGHDVGSTDFEPPFDQAWAVISEQLSVI